MHPLSALDVHPLTQIAQLRARHGVVGRQRLGHGRYALLFADCSAEVWEFSPETGRFELTELTCQDVAAKTWQDEW